MKTTPEDFQTCVSAFEEAQARLGLGSFFLTTRRVRLKDALATLEVDYPGKRCTLSVATTHQHKKGDKPIDWSDIGRHEAYHLLLSRLTHYAHARFVSEEDLVDAEEEVVCILEKGWKG